MDVARASGLPDMRADEVGERDPLKPAASEPARTAIDIGTARGGGCASIIGKPVLTMLCTESSLERLSLAAGGGRADESETDETLPAVLTANGAASEGSTA